MKVSVSITAAGILAGLALPSYGAEQPNRGIYVESRYVQRAIPADGAACLTPDATYTSYLAYPGPLRIGATLRSQLSGGGGIRIWSFVFTPPAQASTWSGNFGLTTLPSGETGEGAFFYALTYVDADSWIASGTEVTPGLNGLGSCTYTVVNEYIRSGSD